MLPPPAPDEPLAEDPPAGPSLVDPEPLASGDAPLEERPPADEESLPVEVVRSTPPELPSLSGVEVPGWPLEVGAEGAVTDGLAPAEAESVWLLGPPPTSVGCTGTVEPPIDAVGVELLLWESPDAEEGPIGLDVPPGESLSLDEASVATEGPEPSAPPIGSEVPAELASGESLAVDAATALVSVVASWLGV